MAADPNPPPLTLGGDPIVEEATRRFNTCSEYESDFRSRFIEDIKFANGDSVNNYQWPGAIFRQRDIENRPCLTMNVVRQHNNQITNQSRRNKAEPRILAMGNGATQESAQMLRQIVRQIEYHSDAQSAYTMARQFQVDGGIGWWRICTDYASNETFDQKITILPVRDPLGVFMDPDCQKMDCSDARFALFFDTQVPRDAFEQSYPEYIDLANTPPLGVRTVGDDWIEQDHVMVCEYFRKVFTDDVLLSYWDDASGTRIVVKESMLPKEIVRVLKSDSRTFMRPIRDEVIEWHLIAGEHLIDFTIWPGKFIPFVRCLGTEIILDGRLDRFGHTRAMRSAQHMYNWNSSQQVEYGGTQGKTPWIAPSKAIEEFETYWNTANQKNHSVLPWNHVDDNNPDVPIPPPFRAEPPNFAPLYEKGMDTAFTQMMMVSGQWQNQMGMMGNERTGKAIAERQEQSDTSVYHFQDNYETALRYSTKILIDLIPRIYNTQRFLAMQGDDGESYELQIDPFAKQAYQQVMDWQRNVVVKRIYNPKLGEYDVAADVGPAQGSRRQQTVDALTLMLTQAPGLTAFIGDILLRNMDFEDAQEAAQRLRRMVPPQALGQGPSQKENEMQQVIQMLQQNLAATLDEHGKDRVKLAGKAQMRDIDVYKAETDRMKALGDMMGLDQDGLSEVLRQLVEDSLHTSLLPILKANFDDLDVQSGDNSAQVAAAEAPMENAKKAEDGNWYVLDPTRKGKYLRIAPLAQERAKPANVIQG